MLIDAQAISPTSTSRSLEPLEARRERGVLPEDGPGRRREGGGRGRISRSNADAGNSGETGNSESTRLRRTQGTPRSGQSGDLPDTLRRSRSFDHEEGPLPRFDAEERPGRGGTARSLHPAPAAQFPAAFEGLFERLSRRRRVRPSASGRSRLPKRASGPHRRSSTAGRRRLLSPGPSC